MQAQAAIKSNVVKLNSTGEYFVVVFSVYNSIESVAFTKDKNAATKFQQHTGVLQGESTSIFNVTQIRAIEFSIYLQLSGIKTNDVTVESIDTTED